MRHFLFAALRAGVCGKAKVALRGGGFRGLCMGYYIRVLTPASNPPSPEHLLKAAQLHGASVTGDIGVSHWDSLVLINSAGQEICALERNEVSAGSLAEAELAEFQDELADCLPGSAAHWLQSYLKSVHTIYAFQVLSGTYVDNGWDILNAVKEALVGAVGGIEQADNEGFSNEQGFHILWQFSEDVSGDWRMAVLQGGQWKKFKMDLGDQAHRAAFLAGEIPAGVECLD